jgi:hypothetical protein
MIDGYSSVALYGCIGITSIILTYVTLNQKVEESSDIGLPSILNSFKKDSNNPFTNMLSTNTVDENEVVNNNDPLQPVEDVPILDIFNKGDTPTDKPAYNYGGNKKCKSKRIVRKSDKKCKTQNKPKTPSKTTRKK